MAKYPSNYNGPSTLAFDNVLDRRDVQDNVASTGLSSLSQTTEPIGDMFKALGMLEVEIDNLKLIFLNSSFPVTVATTTVLPGTVVYNNGTAGVGATITVSDASIGSIDGMVVALGDRILVKNQTNQIHNGIYVATTVGGGNYTLTRATDGDESLELKSGTTIIVRSGVENGKRSLICTTQTSTVFGTTKFTFAELNAQAQLPVGDERYILPVRVATTTALPSTAAIVYSNGTAGVGATLTRGENGAIGNIDGVAVVVGDRILVKNQALAAQNGLYTVTAAGSGGAPYVLTRTTDSDQAAEYATGFSVRVDVGTANANSWYKNTNVAAVTMGTTAITWSLFTSTDGSRPFQNQALFPTNERTYFVNLYGNKLNQLQKSARELSLQVKKMQGYFSGYTSAAGDQSPADNIYPSSRNRGW
jgi:hypothetical protein